MNVVSTPQQLKHVFIDKCTPPQGEGVRSMEKANNEEARGMVAKWIDSDKVLSDALSIMATDPISATVLDKAKELQSRIYETMAVPKELL